MKPRTERMLMSIEREAKHCSICLEYKDHSGFDGNPCSSDGKRSDCKECRNKVVYQNELKRKIKKGMRVSTCEKCSDFFMPAIDFKKLCKRCRYL